MNKTEDLRCAICLEKYTEPYINHCGHTFDRKCVRDQESCPICRSVMSELYPNYEVAKILNLDLTKVDLDGMEEGHILITDVNIGNFKTEDLEGRQVIVGYKPRDDDDKIVFKAELCYIDHDWREIGFLVNDHTVKREIDGNHLVVRYYGLDVHVCLGRRRI